jgi:Asp/Glu/hydantoin racemase
VLKLKNQGAEVIIAGACEDWTNTATKVAPRLGVPIYHSTDHVLRATNHKLYRRMK